MIAGLVLVVVVAQQLSTAPEEDSQEPGQDVDVRVVSLLSWLKSPRPSDFAQKRKIAANPVLYVFVIVRKGQFVEKKPGIMDTFFSIIGTFLENCLKSLLTKISLMYSTEL